MLGTSRKEIARVIMICNFKLFSTVTNNTLQNSIISYYHHLFYKFKQSNFVRIARALRLTSFKTHHTITLKVMSILLNMYLALHLKYKKDYHISPRLNRIVK